jgi:hypothetical protein
MSKEAIDFEEARDLLVELGRFVTEDDPQKGRSVEIGWVSGWDDENTKDFIMARGFDDGNGGYKVTITALVRDKPLAEPVTFTGKKARALFVLGRTYQTIIDDMTEDDWEDWEDGLGHYPHDEDW